MKPLVSIIIVTWNGRELLERYLPSVANSRFDSFEIIIADNASDDDSAEWLGTHYPEVRIVRHKKNFGYSGGNNRAAEHARGEYLIFLNNDVEVDPDWLQPLADAFADPDVAIVQPKILDVNDSNRFEYAGACGGYLDRFGFPFCRGRVFDTVEEDRGQYDDAAAVFWASGAAFAIRKELFRECGGFDEEFRFHMEEVDLCWRLLNRGYRILAIPESIVRHQGGGSLQTGDPRKTYYNFRNSLAMLWKNASGTWLRRYFFLRLLLDGAAAGYALSKAEFRNVWSIFRAHLHFYRRWRGIHRHRLELQKLRIRRNDPPEMFPTSVVIDYFFLGNRTFGQIARRVEKRSPGSPTLRLLRRGQSVSEEHGHMEPDE